MNLHIVKGNWKQFTGRVKARWGKLTDDDVGVISGKGDELAGKIEEGYGTAKDAIDQQYKDFEKRVKD